MPSDITTMAHTGPPPWHGLGHALEPRQTLDVWARSAGMDWSLRSTPVRYAAQPATTASTARDDSSESPLGDLVSINVYSDQKVLYRSDNLQALSVVGSRYQVVQPRDVLEFYRDLIEVSGFEMETAGVLKGGRKFWALARTGKTTAIKGRDVVNGYLLLASSCDGSLATIATPTTIRVVCNNTLTAAVNGATAAIRVPHRTAFDPVLVKQQLGIATTGWDTFMHRMRELAERKVTHSETNRFIQDVFLGAPSTVGIPPKLGPAMKQVKAMFDGQGRGAELASAKGTAWGLLNAVTEYVDHERRARSRDHRLDSAWFGPGASLKQRALERALVLAA